MGRSTVIVAEIAGVVRQWASEEDLRGPATSLPLCQAVHRPVTAPRPSRAN